MENVTRNVSLATFSFLFIHISYFQVKSGKFFRSERGGVLYFVSIPCLGETLLKPLLTLSKFIDLKVSKIFCLSIISLMLIHHLLSLM